LRPKDLEREGVCFKVLRAIQGKEVVLVGGYAVSAYGPPRFSVDLDVVLERNTVPSVREVLRDAGFTKAKDWDGGGVFASRAERWVFGKGSLPASVDMLVDGISDRVSKMTFTYAMLRRTAALRTVRGLAVASVAEPLVPSREVLIALKLHVARRVDLRDVVVLAGEAVDREALASFLSQAPQPLVLDHVRRLLSDLETRAFKDSLKGVYMLDDRVYSRYLHGAAELGLWLERRFQESTRTK